MTLFNPNNLLKSLISKYGHIGGWGFSICILRGCDPSCNTCCWSLTFLDAWLLLHIVLDEHLQSKISLITADSLLGLNS